MGVKLRKKWDLPLERKAAFAVLAVSFLLGGGAGCLFAALSGGAGAEELCAYLSGYLGLAAEGELPRGLWPLMWGQLKYLLAAFALSLTALGVAGLPVLFGIRGFFFVFPVACFCRVFGGRGLFPAFLLVGLSALLWAPALFLMGTSGFLTARQLLRRTSGEGGLFSPVCWYQAGACLCLTLAAGLLEFWIVPALLCAAARVVL
ncbi:hypothetical protein D1641_15835 [Colidextribacter sp. OB.20]|uniref:hypothetical protein n=1 Tax=Colidextribacter sp. OB.20 TaxID=2304568 RepID=UPI00136E8437|nr:hypothetical protein [Colidextribacter sp. OB.20]NBI11463.1 hypothetical protein [Colidextribacter sp. OB.20]